MFGRRLYLTVALSCMPVGPVLAACPSDEEVKSYVDARIADKPTAALAPECRVPIRALLRITQSFSQTREPALLLH